MANDEHLGILKRGMIAWNEWRMNNPDIMPNLSNANLQQIELVLPFSLTEYSRTGPIRVGGPDLSWADLSGVNLHGAQLMNVNLRGANLRGANLSAIIWDTDFSEADLSYADFSGAIFRGDIFGRNDLSKTKGLNDIRHMGPSIIGIDTLYASAGEIPDTFLSKCGVPDEFITYLPSLIGAKQSIQFYSCFISYSHKDEEFAKRLHSRMRDEHLRVWFAPEDIKGGQKLYEQIDRAIQIHDRLLIVLSEDSLQSEWVKTEILKARKVEIKENRQKLFPIRLVNFEVLLEWDCFDPDTGKDLALELREYYIPDFSNWKDHGAFEVAFDKLLRDLRSAEG